MNNTRKLTYTAILVAITTVSSSVVSIPLGFARIFPIQHLVNVLSAVLLGPWYAVLQALLTSVLRNLLGTGSLFAFPGSMIGAFLAALLYSKTQKLGLAALGEVVGTGLLGAMATYPISTLILGKEATLFGLVPAFAMSSIGGAFIGYAVLKVLVKNKAFHSILYQQH